MFFEAGKPTSYLTVNKTVDLCKMDLFTSISLFFIIIFVVLMKNGMYSENEASMKVFIYLQI